MSLDLDSFYSDLNFTVDNPSNNTVYEFEEFRLETGNLMLYRAGEEVNLPPKAIETLLVMVEGRGRILSKDELMERIWPGSAVEESNLAKYLHILRKTLGNQRSGQAFIETFRRRGYRFNAEARVCGIDAELPGPNAFRGTGAVSPANGLVLGSMLRHEVPVVADPDEHPVRPVFVNSRFGGIEKGEKRTSRILAPIVLGALVLAATGFFAITGSRQDGLPADAAVGSIAVLPFENASGDSSLDYLSDGLSEGLIGRLSELPQVRVVARRSSFNYRGQDIDLQRIANELGANVLLTGRLVRAGEALDIRVELIDARENRQIWSGRYVRRTDELATVEAEVIRTTVEKLRLKLSLQQDRQIASQSAVNPEAFELLLRARALRNRTSGENWLNATGYFEKAVAAAPDYSLAHAELASHYILIANDSLVDPREVLPKAGAAAKRAVELNDQLAEAHVALGQYYLDQWEWEASEREFRRAIDLNPNLVRAHNLLSRLLASLGRHDEALSAARRARGLDPTSVSETLNVGMQLSNAKRFDEAIIELQRIPEFPPHLARSAYLMSFAYAGKGMHREAIAEWEKARELGNSTALSIWGAVFYARAGERQKAYAMLDQVERAGEYISPSELATLYATLGENEKAFAAFERAYEVHDLQLKHIKFDWLLDPIRDDPRFVDLLRRINLK